MLSMTFIYLTGCAQWLPARAYEISAGIYELRVYGNVFADKDALLDKIDKKAKKICHEKETVYLGEENLVVDKQTNYQGALVYDTHYIILSRKIRCE